MAPKAQYMWIQRKELLPETQCVQLMVRIYRLHILALWQYCVTLMVISFLVHLWCTIALPQIPLALCQTPELSEARTMHKVVEDFGTQVLATIVMVYHQEAQT